MDGWGDLRATKWQNSRETGGSDSSVIALLSQQLTLCLYTSFCQIKPFTASYDARMVFRAKKDMEHYAPNLLCPKDLVMVEVMISRYKIFDNNE